MLSRRTCGRARPGTDGRILALSHFTDATRYYANLGLGPTRRSCSSRSVLSSHEITTGGRRKWVVLSVLGMLQYSRNSSQAIGEETQQRRQSSEGACTLSPADWPQNVATCGEEDAKLVLYLKPGAVYEGQVVVSEGQHVVITSEAASDRAMLRHFTASPYEPVVRVLKGGTLTLENVTVSHSSPSVASNYAVEVGHQASLRCIGSEITSETGSGICVLGGTASIESCVIKDCKEHGIAAYDDLESEQGGVVSLRDSVIEGCKGYGIQARGEDVQIKVSVSASSRLSRNKLGEMNILQGATVLHE